jgi:muramoyltetrapeptide carboxypeptidase
LRPGDPVTVIAPAGPFDQESFEAGVAVIASRYRVGYSPEIFARERYLAGNDARRLAELTQSLQDPQTRGVFCARGGYGVMRLLTKLPPPELLVEAGRSRSTAPHSTARHSSMLHSAAPHGLKPLIGFSDITALHAWLQLHAIISIHGPVLTQLGRLPEATHKRLFSLLESDSPAEPLHGTTTFVPGSVEGPLLGGNLSVITRLLGTPFMPPLNGAILVLEDVSESPYRLDRMWTHLDLAGVFHQIRGIVLGSFTRCEQRDASYTGMDVLHDLAVQTGLPCAAGFPIGHGDLNEPVPLGVRVRLDADSQKLTFLEPAVDCSAR